LGLDIVEKIFNGVGTGVSLKAEAQVFLSGFLKQFFLDNYQWNG
jgi:hypothetical protein